MLFNLFNLDQNHPQCSSVETENCTVHWILLFWRKHHEAAIINQLEWLFTFSRVQHDEILHHHERNVKIKRTLKSVKWELYTSRILQLFFFKKRSPESHYVSWRTGRAYMMYPCFTASCYIGHLCNHLDILFTTDDMEELSCAMHRDVFHPFDCNCKPASEWTENGRSVVLHPK